VKKSKMHFKGLGVNFFKMTHYLGDNSIPTTPDLTFLSVMYGDKKSDKNTERMRLTQQIPDRYSIKIEGEEIKIF
jgi:hypothetical protein